MRIVNLVSGICLAILCQAGISYAADYCSWETSTNSKRYSFNLLTSIGHAHGARSEDGFYTIVDNSGGTEKTYWFQLCDHMEFNYNAPQCDQCESCGGPSHCGETCSALQSTADGGYAHCTTLGAASNHSYSLIDSVKPETGVVVRMTATTLGKSCSFSVSIYCTTKSEELPKTVSKNGGGNCDYETSFYHSAGCPIVTNLSRGGMGWFATIVIMLLCLFVLYLAVGIGYRVSVLGVSGLEAIPNLDFWKTLPYTIKHYLEATYSFFVGCYRQFTEPTYTRVGG
ncbi:unnamed protein product [Calypogeia fissa]